MTTHKGKYVTKSFHSSGVLHAITTTSSSMARADGHLEIHEKDPGHAKTCPHAVVGEPGMVLTSWVRRIRSSDGGPIQKNRIRGFVQPHVEGTNQIKVRNAPVQAAEDRPAEILVANQPEHP